jgi:hypothetical protein
MRSLVGKLVNRFSAGEPKASSTYRAQGLWSSRSPPRWLDVADYFEGTETFG